jgi:hypothetical protein
MPNEDAQTGTLRLVRVGVHRSVVGYADRAEVTTVSITRVQPGMVQDGLGDVTYETLTYARRGSFLENLFPERLTFENPETRFRFSSAGGSELRVRDARPSSED